MIMVSGMGVDVRIRAYFRWAEALLRVSDVMVHAGAADSGRT
jgi:hypothetical protein